MSQIKKQVSRTIVPYVELHHAALIALLQLQARESEEALSKYHTMSALLLSAFCLEAYLNHIGYAYFHPRWESFEPLPAKAKLELISVERMKIQIDFSRRPFQTFQEVFRLRNLLVHARTETIKNVIQVDDVLTSAQRPLSKWEKICTLEFAERVFDDMEAMIQTLHSHTPVARRDAFYKYDVMVEEILFSGTDDGKVSSEDFVF